MNLIVHSYDCLHNFDLYNSPSYTSIYHHLTFINKYYPLVMNFHMYFECLIQMLATIDVFILHFKRKINSKLDICLFSNYLSLGYQLDNNLYKLSVFYLFIFSVGFHIFKLRYDYYISFHTFQLHLPL